MPIAAFRSGSFSRACSCARRQPLLVQARGIGGGMSLFKDAPKDLVAPKQAPSGKGRIVSIHVMHENV